MKRTLRLSIGQINYTRHRGPGRVVLLCHGLLRSSSSSPAVSSTVRARLHPHGHGVWFGWPDPLPARGSSRRTRIPTTVPEQVDVEHINTVTNFNDRGPIFCATAAPTRRGVHTPILQRASRIFRADRPPAGLAREPRLRRQAGGRHRQWSTAVTLAPAMADQVEHLTMLQRTPSYVVPVQSKDAVALWFRRLLGVERGSALTRRKNIAVQQTTWRFCRRFPEAARMLIRMVNLRHLPEGYPVDEHFNPPYNPWDQRLCVDPDGDMFKAISTGRASVVTDRIQTFTESGILLESGRRLEADIIVTATGLNLQLLGGMQLSVDGRPIKPSETVVYRGMMLSGIPNFAMAIGYTNSSWTLKIGLLCAYFCRLLRHMDVNGYDVAYAVADPAMPTRPLLDFGAGYVQRSLADLPRQGPTAPWLMSMNYDHDRKLLGSGDVADENLHFFVLPCRSQDSGSPRGAVPGTKVKAFDQDNRIGDMRMDRPDDETDSWTSGTASASATACRDRVRRHRCCWWPGGIKASRRGRPPSSTPCSNAGSE